MMPSLCRRVLLCLGIAAARWAFAAEPATAAAAASEPVRGDRLVSDARLAELEQAQAADADNALELALAYDERGDARAADLYRRASAQGIVVAELRLGALAERGANGVPQSYEQARLSYERAVALGVPEANLRLGLLYLEGWGVNRDPAAAVAHIEQAAEAGYRPAQQVLADMFFAGVGVKPDAARALRWAAKAAADHDPQALATVGAIHQQGFQQAALNRPEDLREAREWYQLSAQQDYTRGMLAMASTFLQRGADPENVKIGLRWLDLAASGGNRAAAFHRAGCYLLLGNTEPTPQAQAAARTLLEQSAAGGEMVAAEVLELAKGGWPLPRAFLYVLSVPYEDRYVQSVAQINARTDTATTRRPMPIRIPRPVYPAALWLRNVEGDVLVDFVVDTTGRVRNAKALKTSHPAFSDLAVAAASNWVFRPGIVNGHVVNTHMQMPLYFRLSDVHVPNQ